MPFTLSETQRVELEAAAAAEQGVRRWKRSRALLPRDEGMTVERVAQALACRQASVYAWTAAWRQEGTAGLRAGKHSGRQRTLDAAAETLVVDLLARDPRARGHRATGWTGPLPRTALAQAGVVVGARTIRRALHRLGYRWKRPRYVLGRPDPAYAEKRGR